MTLSKKIQIALNSCEPNKNRVKKIDEITSEFAINFAEWISETTTTLGGGLWMIRETRLFVHKEQLLDIYKKNKSL